jgi:peptidoglycan hydrolase CwlO-like protein
MGTKRILAVLLVIIIAVMTFFVADSKLAANDDSSIGLNAKLDRLLSNQEQILKKLDDITAELKIVKIRATR